jgi:hypothetical protein
VQAELAELADALDSGSSAARLPGSSPGFRISILDFRLPILVKQRLLGFPPQATALSDSEERALPGD